MFLVLSVHTDNIRHLFPSRLTQCLKVDVQTVTPNHFPFLETQTKDGGKTYQLVYLSSWFRQVPFLESEEGPPGCYYWRHQHGSMDLSRYGSESVSNLPKNWVLKYFYLLHTSVWLGCNTLSWYVSKKRNIYPVYYSRRETEGVIHWLLLRAGRLYFQKFCHELRSRSKETRSMFRRRRMPRVRNTDEGVTGFNVRSVRTSGSSDDVPRLTKELTLVWSFRQDLSSWQFFLVKRFCPRESDQLQDRRGILLLSHKKTSDNPFKFFLFAAP